jgi:hypothetical protein
MRTQRFEAVVAAGPGGRAVIVVPFDPDEAWGVKAVHHVNGTVGGTRVRVTLAPGEEGWSFSYGPARAEQIGLAAGGKVAVELTPEGPQRADLAEDVAEALAANPAAGAFFDTLAQFYRKGYLRYIDATTRRPDLRVARIAEVADLLAAGVKERPRGLPGLPRDAGAGHAADPSLVSASRGVGTPVGSRRKAGIDDFKAVEEPGRPKELPGRSVTTLSL